MSGRWLKRARRSDLYISPAQQPHHSDFTSETRALFTGGDSISRHRGGRRRGERRARSKLHQQTTEEEQRGEASKQKAAAGEISLNVAAVAVWLELQGLLHEKEGQNNTRGFSWWRTKCCISLHKLS